MHLAVDGQALQSPAFRRRGVGRYARNLLSAIAATAGVRVELTFNRALPEPDAADLQLGHDTRWWTPPFAASDDSRSANGRHLGDWLAASRPDVVLLPNLFDNVAALPSFASGSRPRTAAVVHDLIPLLFHDRYLRSPGARTRYSAGLQLLAGCDLALTNSACTRRDVLRLLHWPTDRAVAILGAAEPLPAHPLAPAAADAALAALSIDRPFLLYVSGYDRRKNLTGAMAAFAALPSAVRGAYQLVIVCELTGRQRGLLERAARRLGIGPSVRLTGFVDDAVLDVLYRRCRLTLFPSYYEGLGLPLLEALARGAPVVASNRSSIPEFAGPGARLANPGSPRAMADAIDDALSEPYEQEASDRRAFAASFTWSASAARAVAAISERLRSGRPPRTAGPRVAWVSPVPPARSGIADYSAELLVRMPAGFDIALVIAPGTTVDPGLSRFGTLTADEAIVEHEREPFDLFVYHVGNSALHLYMLDLIRRHAGLTVLHDLSLTGLAIAAQLSDSWFGSLAASLEAESLFELAQAVRQGTATHQQISDAATLNGPVLARSEAVVVHSAWTRARVARVTPLPVMHIPPGIPAGELLTQAEARRALGLPGDDFIVATLGEVTTAKRIASIVDAIALLPDERRSATRLFIVGEAPPALAAQLCEQAMSRGLGNRVHFTGRRPLEELGRFACAADVCVQLRWPARGETSAALLRALAAGGACVVSDAGSFAELPADVALRVPPDEGEVEALVLALERLRAETGLAAALRRRAVAWVEERHSLDAAAEAFAAAILLTIARRQARDGEWADSVSAALDSARAGATVESLLDSWAELRAAARAAGVTGAR